MDKYKNKKWLYRKYYREELHISKIAEECSVAITTVSRWAARFEIREIRVYKGTHKGSQNPYWGGGKYKDKTWGYIWVYKPKHPKANKRGYVLEHRLVMENFLGRYLKDNEIIRHINKKSDDNRIKNLKLVTLLKS